MKPKLVQIISLVAILLSGCKTMAPNQDIKVSGVKTPVIPLNGSWKFTMNPTAEFWNNDVEFQDWSDIQVPGECQMQGFAIQHDQPFVYKKEFLVPDDYKGKQVRLIFYGVYSIKIPI